MPAASVRGGSLTSVLPMSQFAPFTYDVPCTQCPLRVCEAFRTISEDELEFIAKLKLGELRTGPATTLLREGSPSEQLFTLLEGWAFRYKTLEDGRRQITSFVLPGDLVGIQSSMQGEMDHSVDTLTAAVLLHLSPRAGVGAVQALPEPRLRRDLARGHPGDDPQ